jgi:hypothetical protein
MEKILNCRQSQKKDFGLPAGSLFLKKVCGIYCKLAIFQEQELAAFSVFIKLAQRVRKIAPRGNTNVGAKHSFGAKGQFAWHRHCSIPCLLEHNDRKV